MESKKAGCPEDSASADAILDPVHLAKVKEILIVLANAVSAAKIFPAEHKAVVNFILDLETRLKEYLDAHWKLELGIEEQAFTFAGKKVYEDAHPVKSLPFFFFKDGMKKLYFYRGLEKEELKAFLETIKKVSQLPPEEGDIVNALWEMDLANIRYDAPDDFLETKIGVGRPPLELRVDKETLSSGRIELTPEDLEAICRAALVVEASAVRLAEESSLSVQEDVPPEQAASDDQDLREIETLLLSNRRISPEDEYLNLITEIVYLEERAEQFPAIADVLKQVHDEAVQKNDFAKAARLIQSLHEIRDAFATTNKTKAAFLEALMAEITKRSLVAELFDSIDLSKVKDIDSLLFYLRLVGPSAARPLAAVFESSSDERRRRAALDILAEIGRQDASVVMSLVQESKPRLTGEIIGLLSQSQDKRIVSFLASFLGYRSNLIKLEAVKALSRIDDETAGKILIGFLSDENEDVRTAAARAIKPIQKTVLDHLLILARNKAFKKKTMNEKEAILEALARSGSPEACELLRKSLKKTSFLTAGRDKTDLAVAAASALGKMAMAEAEKALKEGTKSRSRRVREACVKALEDISHRRASSVHQGTPNEKP
ncbi:MAG: HEAT repeat domain-containing protein [Clostridiales bacterium]|nr:HEAT repeat domain-containing protein [Clostridiales bacterium]